MSANLREAVHNGKNIAAREAMLLGAMMAGQAFANAPVAAVHALAYPLGGHYHIPHGLSNSLVLPAVLRFNAKTAEPLYAQLLDCIAPESAVNTESERCMVFIAAMEQLIDDVKLPKTLREMNIPQKDLAMLAKDAMLQQRLLVNNPREVSEADALSIYQAVY
jgi:alcohol dehydrogenase class IV